MSEYSNRFTKIADAFSDRVPAVPDKAWANPSPCEGWDARDVVAHLVEWVPGFFTENAALEFPTGPSVDDDPAGAWSTLRAPSRTTCRMTPSPAASSTGRWATQPSRRPST